MIGSDLERSALEYSHSWAWQDLINAPTYVGVFTLRVYLEGVTRELSLIKIYFHYSPNIRVLVQLG